MSDSDNYFDYVVHNYDYWGNLSNGYEQVVLGGTRGAQSYVEYNGTPISKARDWSDHEIWPINTGYTNKDGYKIPPYGGHQIGSFTGTENCGQFMLFKWDSTQKKIYVINDSSSNGWNLTTEVADLDDPSYNFGKTFKAFDNYSIEIIFDYVKPDKQAGVLISLIQKALCQ